MKRHQFLLFSFSLLVLIILSNSLANCLGIPIYYLFYNLISGLLFSTVVPLYYVKKHHETIASLGIKPLKSRQIFVLAAFLALSIGGQLSQIKLDTLRLNLIPICVVPLIMSTFFEEFLFRGFMQTRFEKRYGWFPAVLFSGFFFSAYHLGYPGFRDMGSLLLLFAVGIGFALSYKLADSNLIVSYFVNFPNAILTYLLKSSQFPKFDGLTAIIAAVTLAFIVIAMIFAKKQAADRHEKDYAG